MNKRLFIPLIAVPLAACQVPGMAPRDASSSAQAQSRLATDPDQAALWRDVGRKDTGAGLENLVVRRPEAAVRPQLRLAIADRSEEPKRVAFPANVQTGLALLAAPTLAETFTGAARVQAVEGEFLTLDLGNNRIVQIHAKVRGGPLRVRSGETAQVLFRQGDPYERDDLVAVKFDRDDLVYSLVGGRSPVRLTIPSHAITAVQTGKPERNSLDVNITVGGETLTLKPGDRAAFDGAGLTVEVIASVAVQGEAANALEGEPYRLELLGWRTAPQ